MGADHMTSSVFDERVARDYEAWYEQSFGSFAVRQEEALLPFRYRFFGYSHPAARARARARRLYSRLRSR